MKWYEQQTDEYASLVGRQLLAKFGPSGYGAYIILKQVIGQNMNDEITEWGFVSKDETMESLAQKCGLSDGEFRDFIAFCDERFIFEKRNGRLFCPSILEQKNNYAKKVERRKKNQTIRPSEESEDSTECTYSTDKDVQSDVTTQHNTAQHSTEIINTSGSSPLGDVLSSKTFKKNGKQIQPWQEEAVRFAENLGIDLSVLPKGQAGSWFKCFKLSANGENTGNLYQAYSYLADHPGDLDNEGKVMMFFKIWNNGLEAHD